MANVTVKITDDQTKLNELLAMNGTNIEIAVGLFSESDPEATLKGQYNEQHTPSPSKTIVPKRPFIEPTYIANEKWLIRMVKFELKKGKHPHIFLTHLMEQMVMKVKHRINMGHFKKLAPSTIKKKGHNLPLKDTMQMYNAIKSRRIK